MRARIFGAFALTVLTVVAAARAETTLRVSNWLPADHPIIRDMIEPWAEQVAEATEGRITIEILPEPLGAPPAQFDIARDGLADIAYGIHGYTPGRFPLAQLVELPFLGDSAEKLSVAYWTVFESMLAAADEHEGVEVLSVFTHGPGHIFTTDAPVESLADLADRRMRVGGGLSSPVAAALGAVPIQAPATQTQGLLAGGAVDSVLFPAEPVPSFGLDQVLRYGTLVPGGLYNTSFFLVANEECWRDLSEADRAAIRSVSGFAFARLAGQAWDAADAAGIEAMRAAGMQVEPMSSAMLAEVRARLSHVEQDWIDSAAGGPVDPVAALAALRAVLAAAP